VLHRYPPLSAPVPPLPLMSAAGQSSMSPRPAASMTGPVTRPNVMTVFDTVLRRPMALLWVSDERCDESEAATSVEGGGTSSGGLPQT